MLLKQDVVVLVINNNQTHVMIYIIVFCISGLSATGIIVYRKTQV